MQPLEGCFERINRAEVHIGSLNRRIREYLANEAYVMEAERDWQTPPYPVHIYAKKVKDPPATELGVMVGDVINNLRAALDNLTWELTIKHSGRPPPNPIPFNSRWRKVRFPVCLDPKKWPGFVGRNLWGVRPGLRADFERLQPFKRRKRAPHRDEFWVLEELWSIDKHRRAHLVSIFVGLHGVEFRWPFEGIPQPPEFEDYGFQIIEQRRIGPLKRRAKLGSVVEVASAKPGGVLATNMPEVHVNPVLAFDVAFEKGPPAHSGRVVSTLERLRDAVAEALVRFESEFR